MENKCKLLCEAGGGGDCPPGVSITFVFPIERELRIHTRSGGSDFKKVSTQLKTKIDAQFSKC